MTEDKHVMPRDEKDPRTARDAFLAARAMLGGGKSELTAFPVDLADFHASADYDGRTTITARESSATVTRTATTRSTGS